MSKIYKGREIAVKLLQEIHKDLKQYQESLVELRKGEGALPTTTLSNQQLQDKTMGKAELDKCGGMSGGAPLKKGWSTDVKEHRYKAHSGDMPDDNHVYNDHTKEVIKQPNADAANKQAGELNEKIKNASTGGDNEVHKNHYHRAGTLVSLTRYNKSGGRTHDPKEIGHLSNATEAQAFIDEHNSKNTSWEDAPILPRKKTADYRWKKSEDAPKTLMKSVFGGGSGSRLGGKDMNSKVMTTQALHQGSKDAMKNAKMPTAQQSMKMPSMADQSARSDMYSDFMPAGKWNKSEMQKSLDEMGKFNKSETMDKVRAGAAKILAPERAKAIFNRNKAESSGKDTVDHQKKVDKAFKTTDYLESKKNANDLGKAETMDKIKANAGEKAKEIMNASDGASRKAAANGDMWSAKQNQRTAEHYSKVVDRTNKK